MEEQLKKILLVEDDPNFGIVLKMVLLWQKRLEKKMRMCLLFS